MTIRFQDVRFGATALVALLHDVIVVIGTFAILGTFFRVQIDALFVTAVLTVIGFSVHDTIVVYDRIRENRARHVGEPFDRIVNRLVGAVERQEHVVVVPAKAHWSEITWPPTAGVAGTTPNSMPSRGVGERRPRSPFASAGPQADLEASARPARRRSRA